MEATVQIDSTLYRAAAAAAAREGVSLSRFVESLLEARLQTRHRAIELPVFDSGLRTEDDLLALIAAADQENSLQDCQRALASS